MTTDHNLKGVLADLAHHAPSAADVLDADRLRTRIHRRRRRRQLAVAGGSITAAAAMGTTAVVALRLDQADIATPGRDEQLAFSTEGCAEPVVVGAPASIQPLTSTIELLPSVSYDPSAIFYLIGTMTVTNPGPNAFEGSFENLEVLLVQDGVVLDGDEGRRGSLDPVTLGAGESRQFELYVSSRHCEQDPLSGADQFDAEPLAPGKYEVYATWSGESTLSTDSERLELYHGPMTIEIR